MICFGHNKNQMDPKKFYKKADTIMKVWVNVINFY